MSTSFIKSNIIENISRLNASCFPDKHLLTPQLSEFELFLNPLFKPSINSLIIKPNKHILTKPLIVVGNLKYMFPELLYSYNKLYKQLFFINKYLVELNERLEILEKEILLQNPL